MKNKDQIMLHINAVSGEYCMPKQASFRKLLISLRREKKESRFGSKLLANKALQHI